MITIYNYPLEYFIYIIIFILVLSIIISLFNNKSTNRYNSKEHFTDENKDLKKEIDNYKKKILYAEIAEKKIKTEFEILKNYDKINDNDFYNINFDVSNIHTELKKDNIQIINNIEILDLLSKSHKQKNIYKVGETVLNDSTFYINKDDICYKDIPDTERHLYEGCVVCSINPTNNYLGTKTKTNINSVCLYNNEDNKDNKDNKDNSIPTSTLCKGICSSRTYPTKE